MRNELGVVSVRYDCDRVVVGAVNSESTQRTQLGLAVGK